jgi:hypothetical protein
LRSPFRSQIEELERCQALGDPLPRAVVSQEKPNAKPLTLIDSVLHRTREHRAIDGAIELEVTTAIITWISEVELMCEPDLLLGSRERELHDAFDSG